MTLLRIVTETIFILLQTNIIIIVIIIIIIIIIIIKTVRLIINIKIEIKNTQSKNYTRSTYDDNKNDSKVKIVKILTTVNKKIEFKINKIMTKQIHFP